MNLTMSSELIVMLTYDDFTVKNANEIFEACVDSKAKYWGCKDKGLPLEDMKLLFRVMKEHGKTTCLEVVEYTEKESLEAAKLAAICECDILMGTVYYDSIHNFCNKNQIKYMPFIGEVTNRPSVLSGEIDSIIQQAQSYIDKGVYGLDLLGYRYNGDAKTLISAVVNSVDAPICVAGSIDSFERLDEIKIISPWTFTIGSAFFDNKFNGSFKEQIDIVCDYINQ
ncbi:hypothetical protein [Macrococcus psychrotolerans]|uniref:4-hydroxythreonine-4-phosphate dehydrogenase n=1 Tax=Macrococcus psychrotolerans TaxID=3039389 RepID=A0AAU6RKD0_9STAP